VKWFTGWLHIFDPIVYGLIIVFSIMMTYVSSRPGAMRYVLPGLWAVLVLGCTFLLSKTRIAGSSPAIWVMPLILGAGPLLGWLRSR